MVRSKIKPVTLRDYQRENSRNERNILKKYVSVIDTSDMGAGKTPVIVDTSMYFKLSMFVLSKKSTLNDWEKYKELFPEFHVMTYESFRPKSKRFSHKWLKYQDGKIVPTKKLEDLIRKGCLFVFDESQAAKNATAETTKACCVVSGSVRDNFDAGGFSRIALLSRTPTSGKGIQIASMLRVAGIIRSEKLIEKKAGGYVSTGFSELTDFCTKINPTETKKLTKYLVINNKSVIECAYDLYENILKDTIVTTMENKTKNIDIYNVFFEMSEKSLEKLRGTKKTYQEVKKEIDSGASKGKLINKYNVMQRQQFIELYKEDIFIDVTYELLDYDQNIKIIIYLWSRKVLSRVSKALEEFNPVILNGMVQSEKERKQRLERFTDPESNCQVLLTHPNVLSTGTNIVDETETITFVSLMSTNLFYVAQHQASGRTTRGSNKKSYFLFVYIDGLEEEKEILSSLADKSDNLRRIVKTKKEITFLTDCPVVYERNLHSITELL